MIYTLSAFSFEGLITCLIFLIVLTFIVKLAKLEPDFWDKQLERQKLYLKPDKVKVLD